MFPTSFARNLSTAGLLLLLVIPVFVGSLIFIATSHFPFAVYAQVVDTETTVSSSGYQPFSVSGTFTNPSFVDCVIIDWGDSTPQTELRASNSEVSYDSDTNEGSFIVVDHTFASANAFTITASQGGVEIDSQDCILDGAEGASGTIDVTVYPDEASVTVVSDNNPLWGTESITASGTLTSDGILETPGCVLVDWGEDQTAEDGGPLTYDSSTGTGTWGPSTPHTYEAAGSYTVSAQWAYIDPDAGCVGVSASAETISVTTAPHPTELTLNDFTTVVGQTGFTAGGTLMDLTTSEQVPEPQSITFDGSGATLTLTDHVTSTQPVEVDSPGPITINNCPAPLECTPDPVGVDSDETGNKVLHVGPGTEIFFPKGTNFVRMIIQDMGTSTFRYVVTEGNAQRADIPPIDQPEAQADDSDAAELFGDLQIVAGRTDIGGESISNGILKVRIVSVDGSTTSGETGISAILTRDDDVHPDLQEEHRINFEDFADGPQELPIIINPGFYFSTGFAQENEQDDLEVTAHFAGDGIFYLGDDSPTKKYNVAAIVAGTGGEGAQSADTTGLGGSILTKDCNTLIVTSDNDRDGLCDIWERSPASGGKKIEVGTATGANGYDIFASPLNAREGQKDLFLEINCMAGVTAGTDYCPTSTDLNALIDTFVNQGIILHVQGYVRATGTLTKDLHPYRNPFHVWDDGNTPDVVPDPLNDYAGTKNRYFGTPAERGALTLTTSDYLKAKAQAFHVMDFVANVNSGSTTACGVSGRAELYGNDAVVALACGFTGPFGSADERQGTMLHEIAHNGGVKHGGGDDLNCKVNQISVMTYTRQMHWDKLPVSPAGTSTNYGWILDLSRTATIPKLDEKLGDGIPVGADTGLSDGNAIPSPTAWVGKNSFKVIWGDPASALYKIKTGTTGSSIDWNGNNILQTGITQDINKLTNVVGCSPLTLSFGVLASFDEWTIFKNNMNFRKAAGSTQDGFLDFQDPDINQEMRGAERDALNKAAHNPYGGLLQPVNKFGTGNIKTISVFTAGQIVPLRFQLVDADGKVIKNADIKFGGLVKIPAPPGITKEELIKTTGVSTASPQNQFNFNSQTNQYTYNMATKGLGKGFYGILIYINLDSTDPNKPQELLHQDDQLYSGVFEIIVPSKR